ncbi:MAG: hypothetical protein B6V02_02190 [Thermoprotei archaeon ex4572_64]|nr:MAG: hypothetical protein B6V02_02190 [Thermoprotei archaeon ex4572_64]
MARAWVWIGKERQREIISLCTTYMNKIIEVVKHLEVMVTMYCEGNSGDALREYEKTINAEKVADDLKRKIIAEVSRGIFHAIDREESLRLVLALDDIANTAKGAADRFLLALKYTIPRSLSGYCLRMCRHSIEAAAFVKDALESLISNPIRALEYADKVEQLEEEVDDLRVKALQELLAESEKIDIPLLLMIKDAIERLESITDKCEDAVDIIRRIAVVLV